METVLTKEQAKELERLERQERRLKEYEKELAESLAKIKYRKPRPSEHQMLEAYRLLELGLGKGWADAVFAMGTLDIQDRNSLQKGAEQLGIEAVIESANELFGPDGGQVTRW